MLDPPAPALNGSRRLDVEFGCVRVERVHPDPRPTKQLAVPREDLRLWGRQAGVGDGSVDRMTSTRHAMVLTLAPEAQPAVVAVAGLRSQGYGVRGET